MGSKGQKRRLTAAFFLCCAASLALLPSLKAQSGGEQQDSLVRLMSASYIEQVSVGEEVIRKAIDATFLHNGTYLICDTSLWSKQKNIINCFGNVRMIQGDAELTSDKLDYLIDEDLAQFRGGLVELRNKEDNVLRTKLLDYNTKDSLAVFHSGASMRSSDGQIIESEEGTYSNALNLFTFRDNVNMYTDSVFVRTTALDYDSKLQKALFVSPIDFHKDDNMLSSEGGWYLRDDDLFFFTGNVHAITPTQEVWGDSLYYSRPVNNITMLGNVQLQDTTRSVAAVSDYLLYEDSLSTLTLRKKAAVALWSEKDGKVATTYCGADALVYETVRKCDLDSLELSLSQSRLELMLSDAVREYRKRASEQAAQKNQQAADANAPAGRTAASAQRNKSSQGGAKPSDSLPATQPSDSLSTMMSDSLAVASRDSLAIAALDSLTLNVPAPDTTKVDFAFGLGDVRIFREDMQMRCDSLVFCALDSIARFYRDPVVWNEQRRQYTSDSLFVLVKDQKVDRANLISNAFVAIKEDSLLFDQIRSTEVMAYFDDEMALKRFDALGGVNAIFYLEENDELATVNKVEAKLMSATLADGDLESLYYFEQPKNDAYPIVQFPQKDRLMKGFTWRDDERPKSKEDITTLSIRPSQRQELESRPEPVFRQTDRFFPGYMRQIRESLEDARQKKSQSRARAQADSLSTRDTLAINDTLALKDSLHLGDSLLSRSPLPDSLQTSSIIKDSLSVQDTVSSAPKLSRKDIAEQRRAQKQLEREQRWAELDAADSLKAARKAQRKAEREQRRLAARQKAIQRQQEKDEKLRRRYIEMYQRRKSESELKSAPQALEESAVLEEPPSLESEEKNFH